MLIDSISNSVGEMGRLPIGGGRTRECVGGAKEEAMVKVTEATEMINSEGKELNVMGVGKGGDDVKASGVFNIAMKLCLCNLIVLAMSGICIGRDT